MKTVCFADRAVYEYQLPDLQLTTPQLNDFLRKIANSDEVEKKAKDRLTMMRDANQDRGMRRYGQMEFDAALKTLKDRLTSGYKMRKEILSKTVSPLKFSLVSISVLRTISTSNTHSSFYVMILMSALKSFRQRPCV